MDVEDDQEKNEKAKEKLTKAREAGIFFVQVFNEHFPGSTTDKRAFAAAIGWDPDVIGLLWTEYGAVFAAAEVHPLDLLCTFSWCKLYLTWPVMSLLWGVTRTKLANKVTFTLKLLYTNLDEIKPQLRYNHPCPTKGIFKGCTFIVDCTECPMNRPGIHDAERAMFSPKANVCTLKYEVICHVTTGFILHLSGGVMGKSDVAVWNTGPFWSTLKEGEYGLGDKGYQGAVKLLTPFKTARGRVLTDEEEAANRLIATIRILIERIMGRFKNAAVLSQKWRGDIDFHHIAFEVQAHMINLTLKLRPIVKNVSKLLGLDEEELAFVLTLEEQEEMEDEHDLP